MVKQTLSLSALVALSMWVNEDVVCHLLSPAGSRQRAYVQILMQKIRVTATTYFSVLDALIHIPWQPQVPGGIRDSEKLGQESSASKTAQILKACRISLKCVFDLFQHLCFVTLHLALPKRARSVSLMIGRSEAMLDFRRHQSRAANSRTPC